jgi:ATP-binding cassette subfamily B protein
VRLDGEVLTRQDLPAWRRRIAWVDPAVHLFNRRFVQNLLYGVDEAALDVARAIDEADLRDVLERLPDGLQTVLGEGGALVSGGEGQRVRLGRAWLRRDVRLVLLDEPFRGLDRDQRRKLGERARRHWDGATMLVVTHDLEETLGFDRVLVVDGGAIVEDGDPRVLAQREGSRFRAMLEAEHFLTRSFWKSTHWRRVRVENGTVTERAAPAEGAPRLDAGMAGGFDGHA